MAYLQAFLMLVAFGTWDRRRVARLAESAEPKRDGFVEGAQARASPRLTVPWLGLGGIGGDRLGALLHPPQGTTCPAPPLWAPTRSVRALDLEQVPLHRVVAEADQADPH